MNDEQKLIEIDLSLVSPDVVSVLMEDVSDPGIFDELSRANAGRPEILRLLLDSPHAPASVKEFVAGVMNVPVVLPSGQVPDTPEVKEARRESLMQRIQRLNVSERIQLARKGGRDIRGILARDPNKEVVLSVLENGKVTESEVEMLAKNRSAMEEVLRRIAKNREWMKKYAITYALVTNPKTPAGIAVTFVTSIKTRDLSALQRNKNVSEAVRIAAKKLMLVRKPM